MKFYRVELIDEEDGSQGFHFSGSPVEQQADARAWLMTGDGRTVVKDSIQFHLSRAGILKMLKDWASHGNNG